MKKCPYCKTDIENQANFCLYCMTSLESKAFAPVARGRRRWLLPVILCAALMLTLAAGGFFLFLGRDDAEPSPQDQLQAPSDSYTQDNGTDHQEPATGDNEPTQVTQTPTTAQESQPTDSQKPVNQPVNNTPQVIRPVITIPTQPTPTQPQTPETTAPAPVTEPEVTQTEPAPTEPEPTQPPTQAPTQAPTQPPAETSVFSYRLAGRGDDLNTNYSNSSQDEIVITGVNIISSNGVYHVPSYIDGKKVRSIDANAFYGSGARKVYVASSVKNILDLAFNGCSLTDIYFYGESIYVETYAFHGNSATVTIHCSATCNNRLYRTFQSSAADLGVLWEEWNG